MTKAVIIEDEINNRELLQHLLSNYCKDISLVGQAIDVKSGVQLIKDQSPDIVFLDVEMPGGNGFDILDAFDSINFKIIFVSGYDQYAIKAIKYSALDYLLKPIDVSELISAVDKALIASPNYNKPIEVLKSNLKNPNGEISQIVLSNDRNYQVIKIDEINYIEADGNYITFHLENENKHISSSSLSYYEELLPNSKFFRIHKSYIINIKAVVSIENGRGGHVHLTDKSKLPVAFRRKPAFLQFLENKKAI